MFIALRTRLNNDEDGFTLIELLVVVIIIGILAAIAVPTFLSQREKAGVSAAKADLRNAAIAQEAWYTDTNAYANDATLKAVAPAGANFKTSGGVTFTVVSSSATAYCMTAVHTNASSQTFSLRNTDGAPVAGGCP